ncbi:gamma-interferon-inducible lysosomal thiol reductase [Selaginella moellendorffii]|nr:gamma-interferon-inducible lysosomal thiol reductase [Selaginella moellendorffii]|eukprot:XP_002965810.2 gamma-interferon-inducible lysosomal thiol reductase [Selaginella moellendorffii]
MAMADHRLTSSLLALPLFFLVAVVIADPDAKTCADAEKVSVELYTESLCPFCANFVVNYLSKFFTNGLIEIVDLKIIPYGNARMDSSGHITCQHGPDECKLNIIQSCAISLWPKVDAWFPFIYCLESLPRAIAAEAWKSCNSSIANITLVEECYEGPTGLLLEKGYAKITGELDPPHRYVPWVVVNGNPLYEDYGDIEKYVCDAYKGDHKPQLCKSFERRSRLGLMTSIKDKACMA